MNEPPGLPPAPPALRSAADVPGPVRVAARAAPAKKASRKSTFLFLQIVVGGVIGVVVALLGLKLFGLGLLAERREPNPLVPVAAPAEPQADKPLHPNQIENARRRNGGPPKEMGQQNDPAGAVQPAAPEQKVGASAPDVAPNLVPQAAPDVAPIPEADPVPDAVKPPIAVKVPRMGVPRFALGGEEMRAAFEKAQVSRDAAVWWCQEGFFAYEGASRFEFTDLTGRMVTYVLIGGTEQYLQLETEDHNERIHLYSDRAEGANEPFEKFEILFTEGAWVIPPEKLQIPWLLGAVADLEAGCKNARNDVKQMMRDLFSQAQEMEARKRMKDVPFGFSVLPEVERFERTGCISWAKPLLTLTEQHIADCRKVRKTIEEAYRDSAARLHPKTQQEAKAFLDFHRWRYGAWPLAVVSWTDAEEREQRHVLMSNGAVNGGESKYKWKLSGDVIQVETEDRRVKLHVNESGRDFSVVGQRVPNTGVFLFEEPERLIKEGLVR